MADEQCPICFNLIGVSGYTNDPLKTPNHFLPAYRGNDIIRAKHIKELQEYVNQFETENGISGVVGSGTTAWTSLEGGIRYRHINELRQAIENILQNLGVSLEDFLSQDKDGNPRSGTGMSGWLDGVGASGYTRLSKENIVRAMHIEQLRLRIPSGIFLELFSKASSLSYSIPHQNLVGTNVIRTVTQDNSGVLDGDTAKKYDVHLEQAFVKYVDVGPGATFAGQLAGYNNFSSSQNDIVVDRAPFSGRSFKISAETSAEYATGMIGGTYPIYAQARNHSTVRVDSASTTKANYGQPAIKIKNSSVLSLAFDYEIIESNYSPPVPETSSGWIMVDQGSLTFVFPSLNSHTDNTHFTSMMCESHTFTRLVFPIYVPISNAYDPTASQISSIGLETTIRQTNYTGAGVWLDDGTGFLVGSLQTISGTRYYVISNASQSECIGDSNIHGTPPWPGQTVYSRFKTPTVFTYNPIEQQGHSHRYNASFNVSFYEKDSSTPTGSPFLLIFTVGLANNLSTGLVENVPEGATFGVESDNKSPFFGRKVLKVSLAGVVPSLDSTKRYRVYVEPRFNVGIGAGGGSAQGINPQGNFKLAVRSHFQGWEVK